MIKVGIVGVGTIGFELARRSIKDFKDDVRLIGVVDINQERERAVRRALRLGRKYSLKQLVRASDLVIEAASAHAAYPIAHAAMTQGKDVMLMSVGGLLHHEKDIYELARQHRSCIYLPSGAVSGIDGLKSGAVGKIKSVQLVTRKNPKAFLGAPYVTKKKINLDRISKETLLFDGSAEKAIVGFPQNINVSASLSLAGIGARKTRVKIYAVPGLPFHIHEVTVEGEFGTLFTRTQNLPSRENPKTSRLAVLSAVATLNRILQYVKIGT